MKTEKVQITREVEQDKRILTYQRDKENLEIWKLESDIEDEKYRVDNFITNGVYFVALEGKNFTCDCPDFQNRCSELKIRCKHILAVENWKARGGQVKVKEQKFDPQKYLIKIKGKDYLEVKYRLHWFRQEHSDWGIKSELVKMDLELGIAIVRADIYDDKGNHKSSGMSMEYQKNFFDYLQKAETSATGRALAALGYGTLQSLDLDEGVEKGRIVDAPVSLGASNGRNGNGKIQVHVFKPSGIIENGKVNGTNGAARAEEDNEGSKASLRQVRYIKDLCKDLGEKPRIDVARLSRENASMIIEGLQKELQERKKK
ncbi:MAG: SWIM zinc finger domain-containing protein [Candidatus Margulisbacteria bacterium]|nr:SWIM zinc finger domain-containing protein [Candidatus Margulisiibacteriota bacterium]